MKKIDGYSCHAFCRHSTGWLIRCWWYSAAIHIQYIYIVLLIREGQDPVLKRIDACLMLVYGVVRFKLNLKLET